MDSDNSYIALICGLLAYQWVPIIQLIIFEDTQYYFALMPLHYIVGLFAGICMAFPFLLVDLFQLDTRYDLTPPAPLTLILIAVGMAITYAFTLIGWNFAPILYQYRLPNADELPQANYLALAISMGGIWVLLFGLVWFLIHLGSFITNPEKHTFLTSSTWHLIVYLGILTLGSICIILGLHTAQLLLGGCC